MPLLTELGFAIKRQLQRCRPDGAGAFTAAFGWGEALLAPVPQWGIRGIQAQGHSRLTCRRARRTIASTAAAFLLSRSKNSLINLMAEKHPYISGGGALVKAIQHFRNSLPATIDASVLKKLGLAPKNESYLMNILQFIGIIAEDGNPTPDAKKVFTLHDDASFGKAFSDMLKQAYHDLFGLHGEKAWTLDQSALVTYFRQADQTSSVVGTRQATTFQALSALAGHGDTPSTRATTPRAEKQTARTEKAPKQKPEVKGITPPLVHDPSTGSRDLGLTVRIEINLPASGDKETYDHIFKSIKENLLNG
jgi:hypothetical protein